MVIGNAINGRIFTYSVSGLDGTTTGSTLIFTPISRFTPISVTLELTSVTGFVTVASCSIGTNGASYNNLLGISALTGILSANNLLTFPITSLISSVASGTGIYVNITTGAISTTYILKVSITGFYD